MKSTALLEGILTVVLIMGDDEVFDDKAFERWLKSTPEYWSDRTDEKTADLITPRLEYDFYLVSGEIGGSHKEEMGCHSGSPR